MNPGYMILGVAMVFITYVSKKMKSVAMDLAVFDRKL